MSTAKWQNIAGSKKFFSHHPLITQLKYSYCAKNEEVENYKTNVTLLWRHMGDDEMLWCFDTCSGRQKLKQEGLIRTLNMVKFSNTINKQYI